jgi:hypothetical protein
MGALHSLAYASGSFCRKMKLRNGLTQVAMRKRAATIFFWNALQQ